MGIAPFDRFGGKEHRLSRLDRWLGFVGIDIRIDSKLDLLRLLVLSKSNRGRLIPEGQSNSENQHNCKNRSNVKSHGIS